MRQEIAAAYDGALGGALGGALDRAPGGDRRFILPPTGPGDARHLYPLRLNPAALRIGRDDYIGKLKEAGIGVSVHFIPLHLMPFYKDRYALAENDFPETVKSYRQEISLPIWPGMDAAQIERVIAVVQSIAAEYTV